MSGDFDPYRILGVSWGASAEQLRASHRQRQRLASPDFGGSAAKLAEVNTAYAVLTDPAKKFAFERFRQNPSDPQMAAEWTQAYQAAESAAAASAVQSTGSEVEQLAAKLQASHGARVAAGAIMGALVGALAGGFAGSFTSVAMPIAASIGGGIGLIGGAWAAASNSA